MPVRPRLLLSLALASTATVAGAQARSHALLGRVTGPANAPVAEAEVHLLVGDEVVRRLRTDTAGRFQFLDLDSRGFSVRVRRIGYQPRSVSARSYPVGAPRRLELALEPMPAELEEVLVVGRTNASRGRLREFYAHRAQSRFGHFFDRDDIASRRPRYLSDLMRFVPGARLEPGRIGSRVRVRGCRPLLWIDGVRVPGAELDEVVSMADVEAVEVYNSFAGIPAQYVDRNTNCGAIVVWMKS